jgi:hypothetical protein
MRQYRQCAYCKVSSFALRLLEGTRLIPDNAIRFPNFSLFPIAGLTWNVMRPQVDAFESEWHIEWLSIDPQSIDHSE